MFDTALTSASPSLPRLPLPMSRILRVFRREQLFLCCALVGVALLTRPAAASAQECIPGSTDPATAPGPGGCPPDVSLDPGTGAVGVVSLQVTVYWSASMNGLNAATRSILVGGMESRDAFSYDT